MSAAWPLVERDDHLRLIAETVRHPHRRALVVSGPPGVGKTRLAVEALRELEAAGSPTRWVVATQAVATVPFAAVAPLMPDDRSADTPVDLLVRASRALEDGSAGKRVVVGVDDAHLLDHASATLVCHLAVSGSAFLLCTLRTGDSLPNPLSGLIADDDVEHLVLDRLSTDAVAAVLSATVGGQVDGAAVHRLARLSDGNPMLLRGLFDDARRHGAFLERSRLWRLADDWSPTIRLPELVAARLAALPPDGLEAAQTLALAEPLETSLLESLFAPTALRALDDAGLLELLPHERRHRLRFVHPLYGEALRSGLPPLRARGLHRRLADALAATGTHRRDDLIRLATWWLASGQPGHAPTFTAAARQAITMFDHRLAERLARAAYASGGGTEAALVLADALRWQGRQAEAQDVLAAWSSEAGRGSVHPAVAGVYGNAAAVQEDADERLAEAESLVSDRAGRDRLVAARADLAFGRWQPREALRLARPLMTDPAVQVDTVVMASETAAGALAFAGRTDEALAVLTSALDLIRSGDAKAAGVLENPLLAERCFAHLLAGRLEPARSMAADGYRISLDHGVAPPRAWFGLLLGFIDLLEGAVDASLRRALEATALMREHPSAQGRNIRAWGLGLLAEAAAVRGELPTARAALDEADEILDPAVPVTPRALGRAWASAAAGQVTAARRIVWSAAVDARDGGVLAFEAFALHDVVRLRAVGQEMRAASERLEVLVQETDGVLFPALSAHASALRHRDAAGIDRAVETLASVGLLLRAAEASVDAARAWGQGPRQRASAARARELAARCGRAQTPALTLDDRTGLTAREREVAALAASGHSSRDIAQRLVISVRTVDNHLHRIYSKLGISRREDLPI